MQVIAGVLREEGVCQADPLRVPRRDQRVLRVPDRQRASASCPRTLEPVELHHGTSIFSMTVFDFTESVVGTYGEAGDGGDRRPPGEAGRAAAQVGLLPVPRGHHHEGRARPRHRALAPAALDGGRGIDFEPGTGRTTARVRADGAPVAELTVTDHSWQPVSHLYQSFMATTTRPSSPTSSMEGSQSEHEEETGRLVLHDHPFNQAPPASPRSTTTPFRELWMRDGVQTFDPLVRAPRPPDRAVPADDLFVVFNPQSGKGRGARLVAPVLARRPSRRRAPTHGLTAAPGDEARLTARGPGPGLPPDRRGGGRRHLEQRRQRHHRARDAGAALGLVPARHGLRSREVPRHPRPGRRGLRAASPGEGHSRRIDVGRIEDRYFLNVAGFGFDIAVIEDSWKVRRLGGDALYLYCALRQIHSLPRVPGRGRGGRAGRRRAGTC